MLAIVFLIIRFPFAGKTEKPFHTPEEISFYQSHLARTPIDSGEYFLIPQNCKGCHGFDTLGLANVDANGLDINLYDDWETSMMALSAKDPFWRAKVSHEILVDPAHADDLQTFCTSCHAPLGHYSAFYKGQLHYTLADLANDSLGQSGVSCEGCHAISDSSTLGYTFSGTIPYDTNRNVYGPFVGPMTGPMQLYTGLTPRYSAHVSESRFCSPCHTLISNTVDLNGVPSGGTFVEQATYHEWENSVYPSQSITCQSCHMPQLEDGVQIANGYTALPFRSPFNLHSFAGANSFMVQMMKNQKLTLGISASDDNFDSTLAAINKLLTTQTIDVLATHDSTASDTAFISVKLTNKAGHKFPSGYPSRRAVLQFVMLDSNNDTIFSSGLFDASHEVKQLASPFEAHHDVISNSSQSQVYEMVMGDVLGDVTTVLERSAVHLKDNRIPPAGFTTSSSVYDTVEIVGTANDNDFNKIGAAEGSGIDIVHFHVPLNNYTGAVTIAASVFYQTLPPRFLNEMMQYSSAEIDSFMGYYSSMGSGEIMIATDTLPSLIATGLNHADAAQTVNVSPNPTTDGSVRVTAQSAITSVDIYDRNGKQIRTEVFAIRNKQVRIILPYTSGIYYLRIHQGSVSTFHKVLSL